MITFILPYNPEEIYSNQTVIGTEHSNLPVDSGEKNNDHHKHVSNNDAAAQHQSHVDERDSKKMFVILVTGFRTGSTFLGELFNQNADVLYLFEPFHQNHIKALVREGAINGWFLDSEIYMRQVFVSVSTCSWLLKFHSNKICYSKFYSTSCSFG